MPCLLLSYSTNCRSLKNPNFLYKFISQCWRGCWLSRLLRPSFNPSPNNPWRRQQMAITCDAENQMQNQRWIFPIWLTKMHSEVWFLDLRWLQTGCSKRERHCWFRNVYTLSWMAFSISAGKEERREVFLLPWTLSRYYIYRSHSSKITVLFDQLDSAIGGYISVDHVRFYIATGIRWVTQFVNRVKVQV